MNFLEKYSFQGTVSGKQNISYELRVISSDRQATSSNPELWLQIHKLRVQINELWVQIHELLVQIHELQVKINDLRGQIHESRVEVNKFRGQIHELEN